MMTPLDLFGYATVTRGQRLGTMQELAHSYANEQLLKPTATIHVGNPLSLIERKLFNAIIWHSQRSRSAKTTTLSIGLLMSLIGLERSKNTDVIKEGLERLTTNPIVWNTLKKDRTADWGVCTFLAGAELSHGRVRYVLNPLLYEKVQHPTLFAKIQLVVQTQFSSKYSLALYEFLVDELCRCGEPSNHAFQVSLDSLRHVLQFEGIYKHLNNDVLKPCVAEINRHSNIGVEYSGIKKGRAVVALLFKIVRTPMQLNLDDLGTVDITDGLSETPTVHESLEVLLVAKGVGRRKAKQLAEIYDEERIRGNLAHVESAHKAGKVKSFSAYLVRAIEEDYRPKVDPTEQVERAAARRREASEQMQEALIADWKRYRERRVRERFGALTESEQDAYRNAFVERLEHVGSILSRQYKKDGFASRMVDAQFFSELGEVLLTSPEELDPEAYRLSFVNAAEPVASDSKG